MCEYSNGVGIVDIINIIDSKDMILTHCSLAFPHSVFIQLAFMRDYFATHLHVSWTQQNMPPGFDSFWWLSFQVV